MTHGKKPKLQGEDKRKFDTTSCTPKTHGHKVHRDYAAHFFRWGFATRFINGTMNVLEIGCGADQPLAHLLSGQLGGYPKKMVAVDIDDVKVRYNFSWFDLRPNFDFTSRHKELTKDGPFDVIVCLEVIEHMQKPSGRKLLKGALGLLAKNGRVLLSTPVFDPKVGMAKNHIHEYGILELQQEILKAGFTIERRFGTFQTALQAKKSEPNHRAVWEELKDYYSNDVVACFLAPLYPDQARNNIWVLKK